jgi:hypothetical protein
MIIIFGSGYARDVVLEILKEIDEHPRGFVMDYRGEGPQITAFICSAETPSTHSKVQGVSFPAVDARGWRVRVCSALQS